MTTRDFYLDRRRAELPKFLEVLRALPAERLDYSPHERSPSAHQIAWTLTNELRSCLDAATKYHAEWNSEPAPPLPEMIAMFERWSNEITDAVAKMDEDQWNRAVKFYVGGKPVSEQPLSQWLWFIMFDAIHHRGQLTTYLRPMGAKVPSVYGPTADTRAPVG